MKKQIIWVFELRKSVHYWWSYILFSPECKELTSMLDPLLYRWGVPPVVIRCVHWTMQMWVLHTWIIALGLAIVMPSEKFSTKRVNNWQTRFCKCGIQRVFLTCHGHSQQWWTTPYIVTSVAFQNEEWLSCMCLCVEYESMVPIYSSCGVGPRWCCWFTH